MGTFSQDFTLRGDGRSRTLSGLVDTGSTFTTVPRLVLESLGVVAFARVRLRLANGQTAETDIGEVRAQIGDRPARTIICVFGEPGSPILLGAHAWRHSCSASIPMANDSSPWRPGGHRVRRHEN